MIVAMAIGALGNIVGAAITGVDTTWDISFQTLCLIVLANVLGMMFGFTLGVVIRNSAGAIVGYFVTMLVLPGLSELLAANAPWFRDAQPWVDFPFARGELFEGGMAASRLGPPGHDHGHLDRRPSRRSGCGCCCAPRSSNTLHTPPLTCEPTHARGGRR